LTIEGQLKALIGEALKTSAPELGIAGDLPEPEIIVPPQRELGDFATNVALALARRAGMPPREVAAVILASLPQAPFLERAEVAGPGFLNFFTTFDWLHDVIRRIAATGADYGRADARDIKVQVEFVSANPNGPLTLGHARNAAIGDAVARLLQFAGFDVEREYYFNDAGRQMDVFVGSVEAPYLRLCGREAPDPEEAYKGDYIAGLAADIFEALGPALADLPEKERFEKVRSEAIGRVLGWIRATLDRFGVAFDVYFEESTLAERGEIGEAVERLRNSGDAYEAEGATWFRSTSYGDDKDRVLIRSNGAHTYFAADCAYLVDKFSRGFDRLTYVWGADHHGDIARVRGAAQALGFDADAVEILIYQWVAFLREGKVLPMGKRDGVFITLDELLDEVGVDAARFTLLMFSSDSSMNFDIDAVKQQTMENPVYYVQYGHARIASILRKAADAGIVLAPVDKADLGLLSTNPEVELMRALADVPGMLSAAAEQRAPHRITHAAQDLAARFHRFYTECRVVSDDDAMTQSRLWLCSATKQVIENLLGLIGVSAPESMARADG
jgi:arginyl-tRNA synthetase